jgi:hypothetical protein
MMVLPRGRSFDKTAPAETVAIAKTNHGPSSSVFRGSAPASARRHVVSAARANFFLFFNPF